MEQIPSSHRRHERELWADFEKAKPRIFGAMLDTLSKALSLFPKIKIEYLPRMADFAMWGEAIARVLGYKQGEFIDAYRENIGEQVVDVLEQNPIGLAILKFMETRKKWVGTPRELLAELLNVAEEYDIDPKSEKWPRNASWVARRIMEVEANLEQEGINIEQGRKARRRIITIT